MRFKGKTLSNIEITETRKLNVDKELLKSSLEGRELISVSREGKTIQFHFSGDQVLGLHLMLRGELISLKNESAPRFQIMALRFENGVGFAVTDMQKQATATLNPKQTSVPDALILDIEYFTTLLAEKRMTIKTLLMDQNSLRGIGNSYADEILYDAGVSPLSTANAIPPKHVVKIFESIRTVLENAIKNIEEANGDELKGELRDFMIVHHPDLEITAKGEKIKTVKIGGRTTYYVDSQEKYN